MRATCTKSETKNKPKTSNGKNTETEATTQILWQRKKTTKYCRKKWTKLKRSRSQQEEIEKPNQRSPNIKNKVKNKKKNKKKLKSARRKRGTENRSRSQRTTTSPAKSATQQQRRRLHNNIIINSSGSGRGSSTTSRGSDSEAREVSGRRFGGLARTATVDNVGVDVAVFVPVSDPPHRPLSPFHSLSLCRSRARAAHWRINFRCGGRFQFWFQRRKRRACRESLMAQRLLLLLHLLQHVVGDYSRAN